MENEKQHKNYPSRYKIGEKVKLILGLSGTIENSIVKSIHFTESKVKYDVAVPYYSEGQEQFIILENLDSNILADIN